MTAELLRNARQGELIVLDPSLRDRNSHHHVINTHLARAAHFRGVSLRVYGHRWVAAHDADFGYSVVPHFRRSIYEDTPMLVPSRYAEQVQSHREDVSEALRLAGAGAPVEVVVHSGTAAYLEGIAEAWAGQPKAIGALAVQLMFRPESMAAPEADVGLCWARYRRALIALREQATATGARLSISTSCHEFARAFALALDGRSARVTGESMLSGDDIALHPHAVYSRLDELTGLPSPGRAGDLVDRDPAGLFDETVSRVLMFSGDPKLDKGLAWVVNALPTLLAGDPAREYWLHLGPNRFARPEIDALFREIRALQATHDRLRVVWGHVSASEWRALFARMDRVVLPYDPTAYRHKTSGVFGDCLRYMRPDARLLLSADGWLAREAAAWGIGHATCQYGDVAGLVAWLALPDHPGTASRWPQMGDPRTLSSTLWHTAFGRGNDEFLLDAVLGAADETG